MPRYLGASLTDPATTTCLPAGMVTLVRFVFGPAGLPTAVLWVLFAAATRVWGVFLDFPAWRAGVSAGAGRSGRLGSAVPLAGTIRVCPAITFLGGTRPFTSLSCDTLMPYFAATVSSLSLRFIV